MRVSRFVSLSVLALLAASMAGCAWWAGVKERYVVCPYDTVWESSLNAIKDFPVTVTNKEEGILETGWIEYEVQNGRSYGLFRRNLEMERERGRFILNLNQVDGVTAVKIAENREHYGFVGGNRLFAWRAVPASNEALSLVLQRLDSSLKEQGCPPS